MGKRFSFIISLLCLLTCSMSASADDVKWTEVSTAQEFYDAIKSNHSANIKLMNDIDLSGLSVDGKYLFNFTFSGRISGTAPTNMNRNYGIKKLSHILFSKMNNANISNFAVVECSFDGNDTSSGQLADECNNSTISNVIFSANSANGDVTGYDCDRMGGAVGKATDSHFLSLFFTDCKMITDGSYLGLVVGDAKNCEFSKCVSNLGCELWADGNLTSDNSAYAGGFCGYADGCTFTQCFNFGTVMSDDDRIGGIIGFGTNKTSITDCRNGGVVKHCRKEGFGRIAFSHAAVTLAITGLSLTAAGLLSFAALYYGSSTLLSTTTNNLLSSLSNFFINAGDWYTSGLSTAVSYIFAGTAEEIATLIVAAMPFVLMVAGVVCLGIAAGLALYSAYGNPDEMGGIAGTLHNNCSVLRCTNSGPVECRDAYAGGIVGYLDGSTIESCYNRSFVKGSEYIAGIAGYVNNGTVRNCLSVGPASDDKSGRGGIDGGREGNCTLKNNYYLSDVNTTAGGSTSFTQEQLPSGMIAKTLNDSLAVSGGEKIWCQNLGEDFYPAINDTTKTIVESTISNYSLWQKVSNSTDFFLAAANPNAMIEIEKDIDLGNYYFNLASTSHPFRGTIKGNGHKLSNVNYQAEQSGIISEHENNALFPITQNATFENLVIDSVHITHMDQVAGSIHTEAILVAQSHNSHFNNITIRNSSITKNSDPDYLAEVGGLVAISSGDTITGCTVESSCRFEGYSGYKNTDTNVGGIVAKAYNTYISGCHNAATIWADDNQEGGIAAYAENCTIEKCLNTGGITAQENVGGICGNAVNTVITKCVNTGWIDDDENKREDKRSGIVGVLNGGKAIVSYCLNFGSVNYADDNCSPINDKRIDGAKYGEGNYYYCQFNGSHIDNTEKTTDATYAKMTSGEWAYKNEFYQSIDSIPFVTRLPCPIIKAGKVYANYNCNKKAIEYSNIYRATTHECTEKDAFGRCMLCGAEYTAPEVVSIGNATELSNFLYMVNNGKNTLNAKLTADIDLSNASDWKGIGCGDSPYKGTFDGQCHQIRNMTATVNNDNTAGLFGVLDDGAVIENLIMDNTCQVLGSATGAAAIVGCVKSKSGSTCNVTIQNCGNRASVIAYTDAGGILGGVYNNDKAAVTIKNCFNIGAIKGNGGKSAAIVGYGRKKLTVNGCWNIGSVSGFDTDHAMIRYESGADIKNCYQYENCENDVNATTKQAASFVFGEVTSLINQGIGDNAWGQNIATDVLPKFSDEGVHYTRSMANEWGTICLPFTVEVTGKENYEFYELSSISDNTLILKQIKPRDGEASATLGAGAPVFIHCKNDIKGIDIPLSSVLPRFVESPRDGTKVLIAELKGSFIDETVRNSSGTTNYYIADNKLWMSSGEFTLPAFRAYLQMSLSSAAKAGVVLTIADPDNETTAIGEISADGNVTFYDQPVYNLAGQRQSGLQHGQINIIDGKKIYVK